MKRVFPGLDNAALPSELIPEGLYLVRVRQSRLCSRGAKPFLQLEFEVIEPAPIAGRTIASRLYCTPRALWKLQWFLRDFGYEPRQCVIDELDDKALRNLSAVVKVAHHDVNGRTWVNLAGFAPAASWQPNITLGETA